LKNVEQGWQAEHQKKTNLSDRKTIKEVKGRRREDQREGWNRVQEKTGRAKKRLLRGSQPL